MRVISLSFLYLTVVGCLFTFQPLNGFVVPPTNSKTVIPTTTSTKHVRSSSVRSSATTMRRPTRTASYTKELLPDIAVMNTSDMRKELEKYGISTRRFSEKNDYEKALKYARIKLGLLSDFGSDSSSTDDVSSFAGKKSSSTANKRKQKQKKHRQQHPQKQKRKQQDQSRRASNHSISSTSIDSTTIPSAKPTTAISYGGGNQKVQPLRNVDTFTSLKSTDTTTPRTLSGICGSDSGSKAQIETTPRKQKQKQHRQQHTQKQKRKEQDQSRRMSKPYISSKSIVSTTIPTATPTPSDSNTTAISYYGENRKVQPLRNVDTFASSKSTGTTTATISSTSIDSTTIPTAKPTPSDSNTAAISYYGENRKVQPLRNVDTFASSKSTGTTTTTISSSSSGSDSGSKATIEITPEEPKEQTTPVSFFTCSSSRKSQPSSPSLSAQHMEPEEFYQKAFIEAQSMTMEQLRYACQSMGVYMGASTFLFFQKSELVRAYAKAMSSKQQLQQELRENDPEYRDVVMKNVDVESSWIQSVIDVDAFKP